MGSVANPSAHRSPAPACPPPHHPLAGLRAPALDPAPAAAPDACRRRLRARRFGVAARAALRRLRCSRRRRHPMTSPSRRAATTGRTGIESRARIGCGARRTARALSGSLANQSPKRDLVSFTSTESFKLVFPSPIPIQPPINPARVHQRRVRSLLHHPPPIHHNNPIRTPNGRQPMGDDNHRAVLCN